MSILNWANEKGAFVRQVSSFRNLIKMGTPFEPEANRYVLYISYACPWVRISVADFVLFHYLGSPNFDCSQFERTSKHHRPFSSGLSNGRKGLEV